MSKPTCRDIVCNHVIRLGDRSALATNEQWVRLHLNAYHSPRNGVESGLLSLITAFATLADAHAATTGGEIKLGQDGYFRPYAQDMIQAMLAYLNFDIGRFDAGTLDRLIRDLATAAGVGLPE